MRRLKSGLLPPGEGGRRPDEGGLLTLAACVDGILASAQAALTRLARLATLSRWERGYGLALLICVLLSSLASASSTDERFLDGLRQRQLFTLAEKYCEAWLSESALAPRGRVSLVVEVVR